MTNTKWTAQNRSISDGALVVKDEEFNEVCVIREKANRSYGQQDKEDQRRADLIAAAPEMVELLNKALKALKLAPHSLAYSITPIPQIEALLARINGAA